MYNIHYCASIICKVCGVIEMVEEAGPAAMQGAITDGLTEVIGVSCKLLLSDGVYADPDQSLSMGRVSSNGSIPGLVQLARSRPTPSLYKR